MRISRAAVLIVFCLLYVVCISNAAEKQIADKVEQGKLETYIGQLKDADPAVRLQAVKALGKMGPEAAPATEALCRALGDNNYDVANEVAEALAHIGKTVVPELVEILVVRVPTKDNIRASVMAQAALVRMGPEAEPAVLLLADAIKAGPDLGSSAAARTLIQLKVPPEKIITALQPGLEWPRPARIWVHCVLGSLEQKPEKHIQALVKMSRLSGHWGIRHEAICALGVIGPKAEISIPSLIALLNEDSDELLRARCATTLGRVGLQSEEVGIALGQALGDESDKVKLAAIRALGSKGINAIPALEQLIEALQSQDRIIVADAVHALGRIGPEAGEAAPALAKLLKDESPSMRRLAALALIGIGSKAESAISALIEALEDKHSVVRESCALALGSIGPAAKQALPELRKALEDKEPKVRSAAKMAIEMIEGRHPPRKPLPHEPQT